MILFLADKLAWDQEGTPPFYEEVSAALDRSLEDAALTYIEYVLNNGMILYPHARLLEAREWLRRVR